MKVKTEEKVPMQEYDPYLTITGIPNYANNSYETGKFIANSLGFRSPEILEKKSFRIIVVGGSTVWGTGASSNETTFPAFVKRILKEEHGKNIEVINAGMGAYFSFQELILLTHKLVYLNPDLVIFFNGYNDIFASSQIKESEYIHNQVQTYYELKNFLMMSTDLGRKQSFLTFLKNKILQKISPLINPSQVDTRHSYNGYSGNYSFNLKGVRNYTKNMEIVSDILLGQGINGLYVLQPYLPLSDKRFSVKEKRFFATERNIKNKIEVFESMYSELEKGLSKISKSKKIAIESYLNVFDEEIERCFFDHVHTTDFGNEVIARRLSKWIINNILLKDISKNAPISSPKLIKSKLVNS